MELSRVSAMLCSAVAASFVGIAGCDRGPASASASTVTAEADASTHGEPLTSGRPTSRPSLRTQMANGYSLAVPPRPRDARLNSYHDLMCRLGDVADELAAARADERPSASEAHKAAVVARLHDLQATSDALRRSASARAAVSEGRDAKDYEVSEFAAITSRIGFYVEESTRQLALLREERPAVHAALFKAMKETSPEYCEGVERLEAAGVIATPAQQARRTEAFSISQCQTLRSQIELYRLQHVGDALDLHRGWAQLLSKTDSAGRLVRTTAGRTFGPYLQTTPVNPMTSGSTITVIDTREPLRCDGHAGADFIYHTASGKFWSVTADGKLLGETEGVVWSPETQQAPLPKPRTLADLRPRTK